MIDSTRRLQCLRWAMLAVALLFAAPLLAGDAVEEMSPWVWCGDAASLHKLNECQLEDLFRRATIHAQPVGWLPGEVIVFKNLPASRGLKLLANACWKGKHIEADGYFINQWKKKKALDSCLQVGPSFLDGCPCFVFEYPRFTPLFGPMRDEYREIAPGLFLGRMYRQRPWVRFYGYNYLQLSPTGDCVTVQLLIDAAPIKPAAAISTAAPVLELIEEAPTIAEPIGAGRSPSRLSSAGPR